MRGYTPCAVVVVIAVLTLNLLGLSSARAQSDDVQTTVGWTTDFDLSDCVFESSGANRYFVLEPGYQLELRGVEDGDSVTLVITVLHETQRVDGIETRVVEERESVAGELVEVSRNFFAFCQNTGSVFYFGEDVDIYDNGEVGSHEGAWRAGVDSARAGLMIPGLPLLGAAYYQEIAPGVAMDRARIVNMSGEIETPPGRLTNCLITEESSDLEPGARETKVYAPGIGLVKDGALLLVRHEMIDPAR